MLMERRRIDKPEEHLWSKAVQALATLEAAHITGHEKITHINELIGTLPSSTPIDQDIAPPHNDSLKTTYRKLHIGLNDIKSTAGDELKAIAEALEQVSVLIALKRSPDNHVQEKRAKRARLSSPASGSRTPGATPPPHSLTISMPARPSQPHPITTGFSREPKARREALAGQLPLQPGRKVAFRPPPNKGGANQGHGDGKNKAEGDTGDENAWILAVVKRCINQDKNRYEVQDVEEAEDGKPGPSYNTTLRALIPLPDPTAPPGSITHPSSYEEFPVGSIVMAQYPDTTTFYRAEVVLGPREALTSSGRNGSSKSYPVYRLKFEDDDGQVRLVAAHLVVEWPGDN